MDFHSSEQAIAWFRDRNLEGNLTLKPSYQRNAVWMLRQKCFLIESVLKGFPIPEVFINQTTSEDGTTEYAVVDGQQRIRTLLQFVGADSDEDQVIYDSFTLDKLDTSSDWYGMSFDDLSSDDKKAFYKYKLAIRYLDSELDVEMKEMFRRINTFTAPLKPQELRNATYGGPFARLAIKFADDYGDFFAENRIISAAAIRRMFDIEFVAELLIGTMHGPQGGRAAIVDEYYQQYEDYEDEFPRERQVRKSFMRAMTEVDAVVENLRETRWSNKTDFYSLFTVLAHLAEKGELTDATRDDLRARLVTFTEEIDQRISVDTARVSPAAADYVRNVIRGANDKGRRAVRHSSLLKALQLPI